MSEQVPEKKSGSGAKWLLLIPVGCLGCILLCAGGITGMMVMVMGMLKSSTAYQESLAIAQENVAVQEALGTPIEAGMFLGGNVETNPASSSADLAIPISGPNGSGTLFVSGTATGGPWEYSVMHVIVNESGETIELLE